MPKRPPAPGGRPDRGRGPSGHHERFRSSRLRTGIGGSVWLTATTAFQLSLSVAHGRGADTRVNFGGGFVF